ncbi:cell division protein FtsA [Legionella geestiana]|uniref:Cell division protein FtsA n=1 Tax=Legionella geestiana TaxID=45065 RepID=A0A0W0TZA6_9GAMM|nr:cell division protein FtsA [Legionella geestiana]KTD00960.1 cell division protein FtsA [Legionella geestiana]QBS11992.1 cell division protein FtsA [Legionella geestiana]QDQ40398.1 cell division protein FtsA [Legionella geestiana]STX53294.1 cell division protein FtsA [Legionella geestiana]
MAKKPEKNIITGLDIGTSKVIALIGEVNADGTIEVTGMGRHPSRGLKRGVVVDIEATVNSIQRAVQEAELMAGTDVRTVYAGIAGSHIRSLNSHGIVAIRDQEVSAADVERVIDAAKAVAIPADQKILHVLPQEFIIDNQGSIREPAGMAGVRLEARVHIVTGAVSAAQNIAKCVRRCGLDVGDIILEQLASSHAVLTDDEKALGVCLIDIGGGTTDVAVFVDGAIAHTAVIPIAGDQVTNDIAMALRTPAKAAEAIKLKHACALPELADSNQMIDVLSVNERPGRKISARALSEVVAARYEELFTLVHNELKRSGFADSIVSGIVLTGGASCVNGAIELAELTFQMPVRRGNAVHVAGLAEADINPSLSTAVGLLLHGFQQQYESGYAVTPMGDGAKGVWSRMKAWFNGNF